MAMRFGAKCKCKVSNFVENINENTVSAQILRRRSNKTKGFEMTLYSIFLPKNWRYNRIFAQKVDFWGKKVTLYSNLPKVA